MNAPNPMINDMPLLAFKAALELDALRRKVETPYEDSYLPMLVTGLKANLGDPPSENGVRRLAPTDVEVWSKAVEAYSGGTPTTYDELAEQIGDIMDNLQDSQKIKGDNIKKLLEFCTALHSALLQQNNFIEQSRRPKNPRRY